MGSTACVTARAVFRMCVHMCPVRVDVCVAVVGGVLLVA